MATEAQTQANRKNAQKSTGPKTIEGKKAVAKNALKHGLFTNEAVIAGESLEDYNTLRKETLEELSPVGNMEMILAERIVSLTWRLKRVERFQSLVIDAMIDKKINSPLEKFTKKMLPAHLRSEQDGEENIDSTLGKVIISDYSDSRVLDRLSIYERRLENSLFKTITELRRTQILREMDKQKKEAEELIEDDIEQDSEVNFASHKAAQNEESSYWQQDMEDDEREGNPNEIGKRRHLMGQENEKQSQFAGFQPEILNPNIEIRNA